ncbi:MAG: hypothetical protein UT76_C0023G0002 [Candidatus Woesebacteria bacterium GW2011_GWB1_40_12]|uniref:Uncharacterized protein n=1 Tax=Candidatus Woesebacteria bacterium GW2011_GWB1_40_12 TaxID=1618576 RepID=A0A0G0TWG7_9BACT|nr:MAG: hypothetical protein UT76_C0023G0002 [Candidatus Woesebacteria bacterium GW2011_GWB1_40_12]
MFKESAEISFWPCHKERQAKLIGTGIDSSVYRLGDVVVKNYKNITQSGFPHDMTVDILNHYYTVTNRAYKLAEERKVLLHLPVSKKNIPVEVNPFLNLHVCRMCSEIEGISRYIPGKGLNLSEDEQVFNRVELKVALIDLSVKLENKLGYSGVNIIPMNVKLSEKGSLIVTDLCADILMLRKN